MYGSELNDFDTFIKRVNFCLIELVPRVLGMFIELISGVKSSQHVHGNKHEFVVNLPIW